MCTCGVHWLWTLITGGILRLRRTQPPANGLEPSRFDILLFAGWRRHRSVMSAIASKKVPRPKG